MSDYYWDNPVKHDRPLITNCFVPGLACAAGLKPSCAIQERDMDMLLTNIALAGQEGRPVSYSRHKEHHYREITFGRVLGAVEIARRAELATEWRQNPGHRGWQSTLTATPALTEMFDKYGQKPIYGPRDSIILRSRKDGSLLPLSPMKNRARQVERGNEMLGSVSIGLAQTGVLQLKNGLFLFERHEEDQFGNPRLLQQRLRLDQMGGRRVFTSDIKHHGRFYCPAQNIPGSARLLSTLNGEQVVELDFCGMHVSLAYALCGGKMDGDRPYEISGFTRKQGKVGLLTALNARTLQTAASALTDNRRGKALFASHVDAHRLLEALKARHAPIEKMLCSDAGMRLMNIDSRIMLAAVDRLIAKGIHCVPIHDSILVQAQYESEACEALNFGWCTQNPSTSLCKIEKKPRKAPQYGCEVLGGALLGAGPGPCPLEASSGWWSSVLGDARFDVGEWVSPITAHTGSGSTPIGSDNVQLD
jgi:hypothetical protein